ncbi:MAG: RidA family protein [Bacteroidota bacterium]|jgi:2-iminobutanoate/2-iminopropanoate deaminase
MDKTIINTMEAPAPIGPYNQAVKTGDLLFISGQIALVPGTEVLLIGSIAEETQQVMENLKAILKSENADFKNVIKTTIFLSGMEHFSTVNEIYSQYFSSDYPARETVAVKGLPRNVNVEISMIASI